jgi:cytochrome c oxidase assembly protein subunit 15
MLARDKKKNRLFYYWLLTTFLLVFMMIVVGGLTRLTNSGLSITEWELFKGIFPPLNPDTWNKYFSFYKDIPQYKLVNSGMTLEDFKVIFYWEYFHRILGRIIGLFFLIPLIYFFLKSHIDKKHLLTCFKIFILILLQGFVGWYMVKSGLVNNTSVSHYRLSIHLTIAFFIMTILFWTLLNIKNNKLIVFFKNNRANYVFYFLIFLLFLQIVIGAFVSGLDAGRIYQTWPSMNYSFFPNDVVINSMRDLFDFNNHGLIQFYHRNIAYLILVYVFYAGYFIYKNNLRNLYKPFFLVSFFLLLQILLGIITLLSGLNIYLASSHQICSLLLILSVINLYYNYVN